MHSMPLIIVNGTAGWAGPHLKMLGLKYARSKNYYAKHAVPGLMGNGPSWAFRLEELLVSYSPYFVYTNSFLLHLTLCYI